MCYSDIRKLSLGSSMSSVNCIESVTQLFQSKRLEEIQFEDWPDWPDWRPLRPFHGKIFTHVSENIKAVSFWNVKILGGVHKCILQHLPSIERLALWNKFDDELNDWHQKSYFKLKYFAWHQRRVKR